MIKIYIDAATNQNKQLSAGGMIIIKDKKQKQLSYPLVAKTNNEAEFEMFVIALSHCIEQGWEKEMIFLYTDSRIVTESIRKEYAKDARFTQHLSLILDLIPKLNSTLLIKNINEAENIFQIGNFSYRINTKQIDLQDILTNPFYWLGNVELVEFAGQGIFRWYRKTEAERHIEFVERI